MRAWARSNGFDVADRGRLPAEVTDAYVAAHRKGSGSKASTEAKPASREPAAKKAPANKAAAKKAAAPKPAAADEVGKASAPAATSKQTAPREAVPHPKPSPVTDDRRLVALGEELAALTERVAALEKAAGSKSSGKAGAKKTARFRRSR